MFSILVHESTRLHRQNHGRGVGAGAGVGGVGGAPPSPTYSSALVSPFLKSEMTLSAALLNNSESTLEAAKSGLASSTSAAPPETWGQAIEVPLKDVLPVSDRCDADTTLLPGAQMSVQLPKLLNEDRRSLLSVEPTVIADGTKAGENPQASRLLLPPATTTTTPEFTAASTASRMACWVPKPPKLIDATAGRVGLVAIQSRA